LRVVRILALTLQVITTRLGRVRTAAEDVSYISLSDRCNRKEIETMTYQELRCH
jgi:hypothetical protein